MNRHVIPYKILALLLALCLGLGGCGFLLPGVLKADPAAQLRSMTTTQTWNEKGAETTTVSTLEFDENGLVSEWTVSDKTGTRHEVLNWELDERGSPAAVSLRMDRRYEMRLSNRYEGDRLVRAELTSLLADGEELLQGLQDEDGETSPSVSALIIAMLNLVQHFRGYRDCTLTVPGTAFEFRYEEGVLVYACQASGMNLIENENIREADGALRSVNSVYSASPEGRKLLAVTTTVRDAAHYQRELRFRSEEQPELIFSIRRGEPCQQSDGSVTVLAYLETPRGALGSELEGQLAELQDSAILEYSLDAAGRVRRETATEAWTALQGSSTVTEFDAQGSVVRTETRVQPREEWSYCTVVEYTYR